MIDEARDLEGNLSSLAVKGPKKGKEETSKT